MTRAEAVAPDSFRWTDRLIDLATNHNSLLPKFLCIIVQESDRHS